jgi:hypothetical protein
MAHKSDVLPMIIMIMVKIHVCFQYGSFLASSIRVCRNSVRSDHTIRIIGQTSLCVLLLICSWTGARGNVVG